MLMNMLNYISAIFNDEEGQGMVEYALIIGLVAVVVIAVLITLGGSITAKFQEVVNNL